MFRASRLSRFVLTRVPDAEEGPEWEIGGLAQIGNGMRFAFLKSEATTVDQLSSEMRALQSRGYWEHGSRRLGASNALNDEPWRVWSPCGTPCVDNPEKTAES